MPIFNLSNFNINEGEKTDLAKVIAERFLSMPQIASMHEVQTGITYNELIPFVGTLPDSGICQSECETTSSNAAIAWTNKRWTPKDVGDKLKICPKDYRAILNTVRANLTKAGVWNPEGSEEMQIIEDRALNALVSYIHRFAWFGDTAANTVASGYGVLTNGTNIALFNCLDGLFQQMFSAVTAETLTRVTIAKNAEASKAAQLALGADDAYNTFKSMFEQADPRLFQATGNVYIVTRSLYLNYMAWLESKGLGNGIMPLNNAEYSANSFRGIPIIVNDEWDRIIRQYYDNGTTFDKPHRAVLTSPANIPAGFIENDILTIGSWYSQDDEAAYIKLRNEFDVKLLEEYMAVVAY
jgi:hypothetical protein